MTAGKSFYRNKLSSRNRHNYQLRDSIPGRDFECLRDIRVEQCHADFSAVARVYGAGTINDGEAVARGQATARDDKGHETIGQRNRDAGTNGFTHARRNGIAASRTEICSGVSRVGICGQLFTGDKHFNVVDHESRLVQMPPSIETPPEDSVSNGDVTNYRERLWPSAWIFICTALVIPASIVVFMPINVYVGYVTAVVLYGAIVLFLLWSSPVIEVSETELRAGGATLPLGVIGEVTTFRGEEATLERGQRLDARAWLLIRGWVSPVAKISLVDESDPTPYWLLSSRTPELVAEAITQFKLRTPSR